MSAGTMDASREVISVRGLTHTFGVAGGAQTTALQDIDIGVSNGEFISLIGPSGCGKSTLLRIVGDIIRPSSGSVSIDGKSAQAARRNREFGIAFQTPVLFDWRSVEDNIRLPLQLFEGRAAGKDKARQMIELVGLTGFEHHKPWQLSGGMQQRVAIARALAIEPKILLMDEPFGALDEMTRERMNRLLHDVWRQVRSTVVFVTHSIPEAVFLSDRILVMTPRPGRIDAAIDVDLPHPRTDESRATPEFFAAVTAVREALHRGDVADAAVRAP